MNAANAVAQSSCANTSWRDVLLDILVLTTGAWFIGALLGWQFLLSPNWPTGGDSASHLLYLWTYTHEILPAGRITDWMPEVFGGFPFLSYYFPLAFIGIVGLTQLMAEAAAYKVGMFAAAMLMPGLTWLFSTRVLRVPRGVALWGVMACLGFLLHEQNSIWGGNLLSTLAGEFTQSYGIVLCLLTLMAWQRCVADGGRRWWFVALLEAATGFANGFALLVTGFATGAFVFDRQQAWRNLRILLQVHGLAFFMLAGWLWPMLQMHSITIPNDALFEVQEWRELLPYPQAVLLGLGIFGAVGHVVIQWVPRWRRVMPWCATLEHCMRQALFMVCVAMLAVMGFLAGSTLGVANIRFFPFVWLFGGLACGWLWGSWLWRVGQSLVDVVRWGWLIMIFGLVVAFLTAVSLNINLVMDWALWNHSGLQPKPQWQQLSRLFPQLKGSIDSPRLLFEHDPANNDIGSTRTLEALPMFLNGRPVLEGLYMESALLAPAVYQLQSEVSRFPSSPLARFPSASMDLDQAALHMRFLWAQDVLVRHPETVAAFRAHSSFLELARSEPFHVFRLKSFDTHLVDVVEQPLKWFSRSNWMEPSFAWFKSKQAFGEYLPVFDEGPPIAVRTAPAGAQLADITMTRRTITWRTEAVGSAHLVRVSWHPRWRLITAGRLLLAGPGFMLVVPEEPEVRLEYTDTAVGLWGERASWLAFAVWGLVWLRSRWQLPDQPLKVTDQPSYWPSQPWSFSGGSWVWPLLIAVLAVVFHLRNPERMYTQAWDLYRAGETAKAALRFDDAYQARSSSAKKEEALFWSAKTHELSQQTQLAMDRYRMLTTTYTGYWLPESLFTLAYLSERAGDPALAQELRQRLRIEFPNNEWTRKPIPAVR